MVFSLFRRRGDVDTIGQWSCRFFSDDLRSIDDGSNKPAVISMSYIMKYVPKKDLMEPKPIVELHTFWASY